jgi:TonB family protein
MLPQSDFETPMFASAPAPVAIAALTRDRALIGLLRSVIDPSNDLILVTSEEELTPHLNSRRVSVALLDSMFIEGDLGSFAERLRDTWSDLVLVVVGTAEEQSKVASQITSGVVYRFLHRPVSAPRVRLFVEAALRRHEVENVERTLEQTLPSFSRAEPARGDKSRKSRDGLLGAAAAVVLLAVAVGGYFMFMGKSGESEPVAQAQDQPADQTQTAGETSRAEAAPAVVPKAQIPEETPLPARVTAPVVAAPAPAPAPEESVADTLRQAATVPQQAPDESTPQIAPQTPPPPPVLTHEQRLREQLAQAEAALQRGELASPPDHNAVDLFRGALDLDPTNTLAKAGLVRVADRLLSAAERALTAGNPEDAKRLVDVAETLTPATARGAFLMMQIEMEHERAALTRASDDAANDKQEKGATYLRLANARLRTGALIVPSEDNARFYLEAARRVVPEDPAVTEVERSLQRELLSRASASADAGNAGETERWLANADGAGAGRQEMTGIRRSLQETLIGARTDKLTTLAQSFDSALAAKKLLQPADGSAKTYLLALINTDANNPAVAGARQGLGVAYLGELRSALTRGDVTSADAWLLEARTIGFASADLNAAASELAAAREKTAQHNTVVGANSLQRLEYVAAKFPAATRNRSVNGWVELEFTVKTDGSTADVVVTNSSPRRTFDSSAVNAVSQWRYKPVVRDGKPVDQRAAVRIRFSDGE